MAGYLRATGSSCTPTGSPQYHPHTHPMGVSSHPHPHPHPHPGAPHHALSTPFTLGHGQPHPLEHTLPGYPQVQEVYIEAFFPAEVTSDVTVLSTSAAECLMQQFIILRGQDLHRLR
ncbi:hypothetical protein EAI_10490 [Harpegnathos saltator]|uniref:Uncharacterized protein n=1 Tax=Harpegnathos saltator TaxID=610380 RepID=E2BY03_HARSA|nr:hypothetical protein EAI_10490 [Harpegnathos saltator]